MKKRIVTFLLAAVMSFGGFLVTEPMTVQAITQDEGGGIYSICTFPVRAGVH